MKAKKPQGLSPHIDPKYCRFRLQVRPSKIHRWGIFSLERIPKGRQVIEYTGKLVSRKEGKRRSESAQIHCLFTIDPYWYLDGAEGGSGAEFINHCCDPNMESRIVSRRILYFSIKDIEEGEELSLDYHFAKNQERVVCGCGSPKCRGTINLLE